MLTAVPHDHRSLIAVLMSAELRSLGLVYFNVDLSIG